MKRNPYLIRGQFAGIALLAAIALHGCGNRLTEEQEKPSATMENELYCSLKIGRASCRERVSSPV